MLATRNRTIGWFQVVVTMLALSWGCTGIAQEVGQDAPREAPADGRREAPPWAPRPGDPDAVEPVRAPVVSYGDDFAWNYKAPFYRGAGSQDGELDREPGEVAGERYAEVRYFEFSLTEPLNPAPPLWDPEAMNARFYGGTVALFTTPGGRLQESGTNVDHGVWRDNINLHTNPRGPGHTFRAYGVWLWRKADFLNGADAHPVSFREDDLMALHVARYWHGLDNGRFVVQEGEQFYISERAFVGDGGGGGETHVIHPARERWTPYNPRAPYHIMFEPEGAEFREVEFRDVQAVGYYMAKHTLDDLTLGVKMEGFEVHATVSRPRRPSEHMHMVTVPAGTVELGGQAVPAPPLHVSATPVPYTLWRSVFRWATSNMYALEPRYIFDREGDMGSMRLADGQYHGDEPVTGISFADALAWCNALSELEGRRPVYYADAGQTEVFRIVRDRHFMDPDYAPRVWVDWEADGYRLPTAAEWLHAFADADPTPEPADRTHPVGAGPPNRHGLTDMASNAAQWIWTGGDEFDAARTDALLVLGGGVHGARDPRKRSASPYGDRPWEGRYDIGLRVVRNIGADRAHGGPALDEMGLTAGHHAPGRPVAAAAWVFAPDTTTAAPGAEPEGMSVPDMVHVEEGSFRRHGRDVTEVSLSSYDIARTPVTWREWKSAYDWGRAHGYRFNRQGDMGSMAFRAGEHAHGPDAPVTRVSWYDTVAWCNALSEMQGRRPVYYADEEHTQVYREAFALRLPIMHLHELGRAVREGMPRSETIYVDWSADGYRLPTEAEWEYATRAGSTTRFPWGDAFDPDYTWLRENSGGTAHPVGRTRPNEFGLHDTIGNVFEWCWEAGGTNPQPDNYDPYEIRNPKGTNKEASASSHYALRGGSFRYGAAQVSSSERWNCLAVGAYPELGFRVVRCEEDTHPADGNEKVEFLHVDAPPGEDPDDLLQGATPRGNVHRTGEFTGAAPVAAPPLKWSVQLADEPDADNPPADPVVVGGRVFVGMPAGLLVLDAATGERIRLHETDGAVAAGPTVADGVVYFNSDGAAVHAVRAADGEPLWRHDASECGLRTGPLVAYGAVFYHMSDWGEEGGTVALDARTGERICRYLLLRDRMGVRVVPTLWRGEFIFDRRRNSSSAALNVRTGRVRIVQSKNSWQTPPGVPAARDGRLFSAELGVAAADLENGRRLWHNWLVGTGWNDDETVRNATMSSPAAGEELVFAGASNGRVYALEVDTGEVRWEFTTDGVVSAAPALVGGVLLAGSEDGRLYALDAADGTLRGQVDAGSPIVSDIWVADGVAYFITADGRLHAVE